MSTLKNLVAPGTEIVDVNASTHLFIVCFLVSYHCKLISVSNHVQPFHAKSTYQSMSECYKHVKEVTAIFLSVR